MDRHTKLIRNPDVLWREEEEAGTRAYEGLSHGEDVGALGTSVLFSDGLMLSLNVLGTEIWKHCDGKSVDDLVSGLLARFEVEPEVLRRDTMDFLAELAKKDFIRYDDR